jgi:GrpB-like predicted nucleotidyltransferase (UPF0157 family)
VTLAEYDSAWPARFAAEVRRIHHALGGRPITIEHVGSTSIPGLTAKPVIDIAMGLRDPTDEPGYVPSLEAAGYTLRIREPDWHEHRMLRRDEPRVNLHVFGAGCIEIRRMLRFRDRLRASEGDRIAYEDAKRQLAARSWALVQDYADAKAEVIEQILRSG